MIIKKKKNVNTRSKELPLVHHSHESGEISRFVKAFHSNCKHVKSERLGCAALVYTEGVTKYGNAQTKV